MKTISKKQNVLSDGFFKANILTRSGNISALKVFIPIGLNPLILCNDIHSYLKGSIEIKKFKLDYYTTKNDKIHNSLSFPEHDNLELNFDNSKLKYENYYTSKNILKINIGFLNNEKSEIKCVLPVDIDVLKFYQNITTGLKRHFNVKIFDCDFFEFKNDDLKKISNLGLYILNSETRLPLPEDIIQWSTNLGVSKSVYNS